MREDITFLYYFVDNFCKCYNAWVRRKLIPGLRQRCRDSEMSLSELLTVVLSFYLSPCKDFKNYYLYYLSSKHKGCFSKLLSYSRIVQLLPRLMLPLTVMLHCLRGEETGVYYVDSTKIQICHNKRTSSNRVFKGICAVGKSSYGWFMGYKLHIIINNKGEIMGIKITKGNKSDISVLSALAQGLKGKIYGDKGYISKEVWNELFTKGLQLFTSLKRTMKNYLMNMGDKINLRKRSLIESVFNVLKNRMNLEHTRHRSPTNFLVHIISCIISYTLKPAKINKLNTCLIQN
jgi:hypothetical protein